MDYFTINSEREENNRVLQNLKDAMKQRNLAMMRDAKKKLDARYGFYDTLSNKFSPWRNSRIDEYNRLTGEYNVLKPRYLRLHDSLYAEKTRKDQLSRLPRRPGESKWEHALRLTTPSTPGGAGWENKIWSALKEIAAEERERRGRAPPPNPNKWKCPACNHMNPKTDKICKMCREPKPKKFQMLKKSKRKASRKRSRKRRSAKRKTSRKRRSAKRKTSRKRRSAKRKTSRKRRSSKRKASRKRSRKRRSSKRCPAGCVKKKTSKRKSRKVKKS